MDSTGRFSNRVEEYRKHRPVYPAEIVNILRDEKALPAHAVVADIGSGTGLLTQLFFNHVHTIYAVEPNENMRRQAEKNFADVKNFISIAATAEVTTLSPASIDLITAAQAFHWFDRDKTSIEFKRILKPTGFVALVWNYRDYEANDLQRDYEEILKKFIPNYKQLDHKTMTDEKIFAFYHHANVTKFIIPNFQLFDRESLLGRVLSSSYVPKPPDPIAQQVLSKVSALFEQYQQNGKIEFIYKTTLYLGTL
jgi:ubiquinone/menaquinone biosynthesis C-methylase UbiE